MQLGAPFRHSGQWWFACDGEYIGPYDTKAEAVDDLRGLRSFDRHKDEPGFITVDFSAGGRLH